MNWQAMQGLGTIVALVALVAAVWLDIRGRRQERDIAEASASRSEAAARLTEEYTQRVVDALEKIAAQSGQPATAPAPRVRWSLNHASGSRYLLTNTGDGEAWDVEIGMHETMRMGDESLTAEQVGPSEGLAFYAAPALSTPDYTITVSWNSTKGDPATRQQWRYPLPITVR